MASSLKRPTRTRPSSSISAKLEVTECSSSGKPTLHVTSPSALDVESITQSPNLVSPRYEHAPLFAHEICQPQSATNPALSELLKNCSHPFPLRSTSKLNHAKPAIEGFPTDTEAILRQLEETKTRVSVDVTEIGGSPPSPIVEMDVNRRLVRFKTFPLLSSCSSATLESLSEEIR